MTVTVIRVCMHSVCEAVAVGVHVGGPRCVVTMVNYGCQCLGEAACVSVKLWLCVYKGREDFRELCQVVVRVPRVCYISGRSEHWVPCDPELLVCL